MLVEAAIGWLARLLGAHGRDAGARLLLGTAEERALRSAVMAAVHVTAEQVPAPVREIFTVALLEQVGELTPPMPDAGTSAREQFEQALRAGLDPLADCDRTGVGRSFLDEISVDAQWLIETFPTIVVRAVEQAATAHATLAPLSARLDADAIRADLRAIRQSITPPAPAIINSLPRLPPDFVDRQEALRLILASVTDHLPPSGCVKLCAIDGMPGVGKTACAVRAAHDLAGEYPDAQLFLDLNAHTAGRRPVDPHDALEALLSTIGIPAARIPATIEGRAAMWRAQTSHRRVLLLLDNVASHDQVMPLLPGTADCAVLLTSRRRLTGLDGAVPVSLDPLPANDAALMFCRVTGRGLGDDHQLVTRVVRLLGHLPLAIRVVAGRLRHRPTWGIADLESRLLTANDLLSTLNTEDRSVVLAFQSSYDDLPDEPQRLFRYLALLPGSEFGVDAVACVAGISRDLAAELLDALVDHNLVSEPRAGRQNLHNLLRAHAVRLVEQHETEADRSAATKRLLDFYRDGILVADSFLATGEVGPRPARSEPPLITDRAQALDWLKGERESITNLAEHVLRFDLSDYTAVFLDRFGHHLTTLGFSGQALALYDRTLGAIQRAGNRQREADARFGRARVRRLTARHWEALDDYWRTYELYCEFDRPAGQADSLLEIAVVERLIGQFPQALKHLWTAYRIYTTIDSQDRVAESIREIARIEQLTGHYHEATAHYAEALKISRLIGHRRSEADSVRGLAQRQQAQGRYQQALSGHRQALHIYGKVGNRMGEMDSIRGVADCQTFIGEHDLAATHYAEAMRIAREIGDRAGQGYVLNGAARMAINTGRHSDAVRYAREALDIAQECGELVAEAYSWARLGEANEAADRLTDAATGWHRARHLFQQLGMPDAATAEGVLNRLGQPTP